MMTKEQAVEWLMTHSWSGQDSLCECVNNKYDGNIAEFLEHEFNVIKDGTLHIRWGDNRGQMVSYDL